MAIANLTGTKWTFNENVNKNVDTNFFSVNFKSNNEQFVQLDVSELPYYMSYNFDLDGNGQYAISNDDGGWDNNYRTIEITGGADVENADLIAFLQANATQIVEPTTNLVNLQYSKWVFKDTIDFTGFETSEYDIKVIIDETEYKLKIDSEERKLNYYNDWDNQEVYADNTWSDTRNKTIVIVGGKDKANKFLISFLEKNATLILKVNSFVNSKWLLNENVSGYYFDEFFDFKSNNKKFEYLYYEPAFGITYGNDTIEEYIHVLDQEEGKNEWVDQAYRTIEIIGGHALKYNYFYEWFMNNATLIEQENLTLKKFLIDVADAIREKKNSTEKINGQDFASEIKSLVDMNTFLTHKPDCSYVFYKFSEWSLDDYHLSYDCVAYTTNFSSMFAQSNLETIPPLNTSNAKTMTNMFEHCENLKSIPLLDTSRCTEFGWMFAYCVNLKSIPPLDTSNGTRFLYMFSQCYELEYVPPLNTNAATDMSAMFWCCRKLKTIDITKLADDIEDFALHCNSLTKLIIRTMDTIPIYNNTLGYCYHLTGTYDKTYNPNSLKDGRIYVPDDKVDALKSTTGWSDFADVIVPLSTLEE